ncbi:MAG: TIGR03087 family PEP-CTERM/XrtA system glycosyltransferase [Thalassotalea sp.]
MTKTPLLFLCHRIPFPPNKGDKITTFNLLMFLSSRYDVHLGCFVDDEYDRQYTEELAKFCKSYYCEDICDRKQSKSGIKALLTGQSVSVAHYNSASFQAWVDQTIEKQKIDKLFVYSSGISQFIDFPRYENKTRILDMADVDSDKWRQYAENKPWYSRWIYSREQRILEKYEQKILSDYQALTLITDDEAALFRTISPSEQHHKIVTLSNGVDTDYFSSEARFDLTDLPELNKLSISFTGAMDYWANEDAVVWFCQHVWPKIKTQFKDCTFYIVGGKPSDKVCQLAKLSGVVVTGRVPDVRPYLDASVLAVAPMRIARGVQNKVLEAMAMAKPVVMTSMGQEGIEVDDYQRALVIDDPELMADKIIELIHKDERAYAGNREWIIQRYSWDGALEKLPSLLNLTKESS